MKEPDKSKRGCMLIQPLLLLKSFIFLLHGDHHFSDLVGVVSDGKIITARCNITGRISKGIDTC